MFESLEFLVGCCFTVKKTERYGSNDPCDPNRRKYDNLSSIIERLLMLLLLLLLMSRPSFLLTIIVLFSFFFFLFSFLFYCFLFHFFTTQKMVKILKS